MSNQVQKEVFRQLIIDAEKAGILKYCAHGVAIVCLPEVDPGPAAPAPPAAGPLFDSPGKS